MDPQPGVPALETGHQQLKSWSSSASVPYVLKRNIPGLMVYTGGKQSHFQSICKDDRNYFNKSHHFYSIFCFIQINILALAKT